MVGGWASNSCTSRFQQIVRRIRWEDPKFIDAFGLLAENLHVVNFAGRSESFAVLVL